MPRNSSGTYTLPAGNPVVTGTLIESTWANPTMSDIGSAITDSLDRFGRGGMLAPMRFTDGSVTAPSMSFSSETTLGVWRPSAGNIAIAVGGVSRFILSAALLTITPPTTFQGAVTFSGGATLTGPIVVDKLYSNASPQSFTTSVTSTPDWQMAGTTGAASFFGVSRFSNGTTGPAVYLGHSRGGSVGTQTVVVAGDQFAQISFFGSDGTSFREGARIVAESDGTPGTADMPGRIRFLTTPDGAATPTEVLRLSQDNSALFAGTVTATGTLAASAAATVGTTLNVTGATTLVGAATLQSTAVIGSSAAIPSNTRVLIDRLSTSTLPALLAGTVLTLAGSTGASSTAHMQLIAGNAGSSTVFFGDTDSAQRGAVSYNHSTDSLSFQTAGANALVIDSSGNVLPSSQLGLPNGSAGAPSLYFVNSSTSGLYRIGADAIGIATAGAERWRVDATGRLAGNGSAQTTRIVSTNVSPALQLSGDTLSSASIGAFMWESTSSSSTSNLTFARSRNATIGNHTVVQNGDIIGRITAAGSDGSVFAEAGRIQFVVDGAPGAGDMPGRIEFYTTPDGSSATVLALTLSANNTATFAGAVAGTTATFTSSSGPPHILINRTGSTVNSEIAFQTTSGTVFVGQGAANAFAVGGGSGLNTSNWVSVTSALAAFNTNGSFDGTLTSTGTARFNGATQGVLGVRESTGSGATANAGADSLVVDSSGNGGLSILTPNTSTGNIYFGDPESALSGRVVYTHSTDTLTLFAGGNNALSLTSALVTLGSGVDLILDNTGPTSTLTAGWRGVPQNSRSANYTLVLADAGKHIYHPSADTTGRTWTIPANASVAFPIGTAVTFVNDTSGGAITIAITSDTLVFAGPGTTGSRTLSANGIATAVKVTATRWMISGTNIT